MDGMVCPHCKKAIDAPILNGAKEIKIYCKKCGCPILITSGGTIPLSDSYGESRILAQGDMDDDKSSFCIH